MAPGRPIRIKPLLLAGGKSSQASLPKHLLRMPDGRPLYQHLLDLLLRACPDANSVYISLSGESVLDGFLRDVAKPYFSGPMQPADDAWAPPIAILYDPPVAAGELSGPAAGLLAAHRADPDAAWLVISCDYPLLTSDPLGQLRRAHAELKGAVTCIQDVDGSCEPLVGVWGPEALRELAQTSKSGTFDGIVPTVQRLNGVMVPAPCSPPGSPVGRLMDLHTETDWHEAHMAIHGLGKPAAPSLIPLVG